MANIDLILQYMTMRDGKKLLLDVTITHPQAQANINGSSETAGCANSEADRAKNNKYLNASIEIGYLFRSFAIESFGRWGQSMEKFINEVASLAPTVTRLLSAGEFSGKR